MQNMLQAHGASAQPVVRSYHGQRLVEERRLGLSGTTPALGASWRCRMTTAAVADDGQALDLEVEFAVLDGIAQSAGVGVAFEFASWLENDYLLLPAAVYKGNDFTVWDTKYPPLWRDPAQFQPHMPVTTTTVPRLAADQPRLEQTTGDTAAPCMGFFSLGRQLGVLLQTTQGSRLGNHGLTAERTPGGGLRLLVTAPCVREFRQDHCKAVASEDQAVAWQAGDTLILKFRLMVFPATRLQELFNRFCVIRKALNPAVRSEELPFSAAWKIVEEKCNRDNWVEGHGYYKMAPNAHTTFEIAENPLCFLWQLGWVGGGMMTLPMLAQGDGQTRARAWRNLEMIFDKTQAPSGFFYGIGDGEKFYADGFDRPHPHRLHMVRKSGDWLCFAIKQFDLLRRQGRSVPATWEQAIRRLADAFVRLWERSGQFGQFVDVETGELLIGGSASGAVIPGALALASRYFADPRYLAVAVAAAQRYLAECTEAGLSTGGPGEILSAPDSESAFALLESFVTLLEVTGADLWRQAAHDQVRQCATWVVAYDYQFPADSSLAQAGTHSAGAVWANIQNKHGAPGICTWSGDSLFRYWRLSGDPVAFDLVSDIAHGIPQYLSREDKLLSPFMHPGWMCERVNLSDWEGAKGVGGNLFGSCGWTETSLMLTTWEIPGLYVQPDTGFFHAFDHVVATRISHAGDQITLRLENSTPFDAEVKILCETAAASRKPLSLNALFNAQTVKIPAGRCIERTFTCTPSP